MKGIDISALNELKLPPMSQLGIVVEDIPGSLLYYASLLNIRTWYRARIVKSRIHYRNAPIDLDLDIAVGYSGALQFELIQVVRGERNVYTDFIDTQGQGIHHIGFVVSDIARGIETLEKAGFENTQHGTLETQGKAVTRFAYYDTLEQFGYYTELIQTTLFGFNVGMSRWMMKVGRLAGDVEVISY